MRTLARNKLKKKAKHGIMHIQYSYVLYPGTDQSINLKVRLVLSYPINPFCSDIDQKVPSFLAFFLVGVVLIYSLTEFFSAKHNFLLLILKENCNQKSTKYFDHGCTPKRYEAFDFSFVFIVLVKRPKRTCNLKL